MHSLEPAVSDDTPRFPQVVLEAFATDLLVAAGVQRPRAQRAATHLITADLWGVESHGVARLASYVNRLHAGLIDPDATLTVERELASTLALDGNNGFGLLLGPEAMQRTIDKARETGICLTTIKHSNHFGIAGAYAAMATRAGLGGLAMTNAGKIVVPLNGSEPMLGTNPMAFGVPTGSGQPLLVDMSTSTVAWGKIEIARRAGVPIPWGWAVDAEGNPTTDPHAVKGLTPLGGSLALGGHKGYGLSLMVETLCGPLSGNAWGYRIAQSTSTGAQPGIGHTFMAWRIDAFRDEGEFLAEMDQMLNDLRSCKPNPGTPDARVIIPGEPEFEAEVRNRELGIPVRRPVLDELAVAAATVNCPFTLSA
ncbi:MAG TPA: Ldh family oxidoreductase [Thermomicrobiales bacterium]|nr:Ldh family oxidoreductase [Thermomicrobiales bacterium]